MLVILLLLLLALSSCLEVTDDDVSFARPPVQFANDDVLQINCIGKGLSSYTCKNYMEVYFQSYTGMIANTISNYPQQNYSSNQIPNATVVYMSLQLLDMVDWYKYT